MVVIGLDQQTNTFLESSMMASTRVGYEGITIYVIPYTLHPAVEGARVSRVSYPPYPHTLEKRCFG